MQKLWYNYDEVNDFHPIVEKALNAAMANSGYHSIAEVIHHPKIPNSTIVPDFGIRLRSSQKYVFIIEIKRSNRDVHSQRYQNQSRAYVTEFSPHWASAYHKYFCVTNVEQFMLFADRQGPLSTCVLKNNLTVHSPFQPITHNASKTITEFQATIEQVLYAIFNRKQPDWVNNWQPIIEQFYQNFISLKNSLGLASTTSEELSLYELFRLLTYAFLKEFYHQNNNPNKTHFRNFPSQNENAKGFKSKLSNNYSRILQLDFKQVFSNHPNTTQRIFPDNFTETTANYFKELIQSLNEYGRIAVVENPSPSYIFNLLTSKIYNWEQMHKAGKIMSDAELSSLLAALTIDNHTDKILDPCCGDGALLDAAYDQVTFLASSIGVSKTHNQALFQIGGIEKDPFLAQLATFRLISKNLIQVNSKTEAEIFIGDAFTLPNANAFDVVVMNPPFLRNDNPHAPITSSDKSQMLEAIEEQQIPCFVEEAKQPNLYFYFVNYVWHYLNENGKAGIILMAKFLNNKDGEFLKSFLLDKVEAIIAYPNNYFEGFKVTSVIVILAKKAGGKIKFLNVKDAALLENPQEIKIILEQTTSDISADYTLKITDRNILPSANWRLFLTDPFKTVHIFLSKNT